MTARAVPARHKNRRHLHRNCAADAIEAHLRSKRTPLAQWAWSQMLHHPQTRPLRNKPRIAAGDLTRSGSASLKTGAGTANGARHRL